MSIADAYYQITGKKYLYNIMPLSNMPSVIQNGILCYNAVEKISHTSIALSDVQIRRSKVVIPGGQHLHDYANLYFTYNNPMLYLRRDTADDFCILALSATVLDIDNCVISDRNAATDLVRFYSAKEGISKLDYDVIFEQSWKRENPFEHNNRKAIKCAEILIPHQIPYDYIVGAYVVSEEAATILRESGFNRRIVVNSKVFYRR